jgi:hypothetical protein
MGGQLRDGALHGEVAVDRRRHLVEDLRALLLEPLALGPTMGMALSALIDAPQDPDAVSRALVRRPGAEGRANAAKVRTGVPRLARVRTAVAVAAHPLDVCAAPEARTRFGR